MSGKHKVYLAAIETILPTLHDPAKVIGKLYSEEMCSRKVHKLAVKSQKALDIQYRPSVLDVDKLPKLRLARKKDHPKQWGTKIAASLSNVVGLERVGFLSLAYNSSFNVNTLPNLASRIVLGAKLRLDQIPIEWTNYGCAGGLYALKSAYDFCAETEKAAIVFVFDQCSAAYADPIYDPDEKHFKSFLRSALLFGDGAIGFLLIPESLRDVYEHPLMEIKDFERVFHPGSHVGMVNGRFLTKEGVKDIIPKLVSRRLVKPFIERLQVDKDDIAEWSIHQGGPAVLNEFSKKSVLGLADGQLDRSHELFQQYGNFSAPSCLFVLNSYFSEDKLSKRGTQGMVVGFGAGYYLGAMYYQWV